MCNSTRFEAFHFISMIEKLIIQSIYWIKIVLKNGQFNSKNYLNTITKLPSSNMDKAVLLFQNVVLYLEAIYICGNINRAKTCSRKLDICE